jgi:dihydrodipicolinate synthase/N-acetylneuraminate lyase
VKTTSVTQIDLEGVFAVPPLARRPDGSGFDLDQNGRMLRHLQRGGLSRVVYGGNAFLYHIPLHEFEDLVEWMASVGGDVWLIPSIGPSYGRAIDQARVLRRLPFPTAMLLPCGDPRDAHGLERGTRAIVDALGRPLILYLKEETTFGSALSDGIDAVARLVSDGVCVAIKYAVVRSNPEIDSYLDSLLGQVDRRMVVSGIGERPAVTHMLNHELPGFTTGSGCVAPRLSQALFEACRRRDFAAAESIRACFLSLEDIRDAEGPARVLHAAVEAAGIARLGPILPYVSALTSVQIDRLAPIARSLLAANGRAPDGGVATPLDERIAQPAYEAGSRPRTS